jgi:uncharacterized protein (DUF488 family)
MARSWSRSAIPSAPIHRAEPPKAPDVQQDCLYTLGYGSRTLDDFVALLRRFDIGCLVDVRTSPYSRHRPEFSKQPLDTALKEAGVRYVFQGDSLGGRPDDVECYVDGKVDYGRLAEKESYQKGLDRVVKAVNQGMRVALMCSEGRPEDCHRSKLIGVSLAARGIEVIHLDEADTPQSQDAVLARITGGQLDLFGQPSFTSRKRYLPEDADDA